MPVYDGHGRITNADPNTFITEFSCATCGMRWEESRIGDEVTTSASRIATGA